MKKRLTLVLAAGLIASATFAPSALAKDTNQVSYWGDDCVKYDTEMGPTWTTDDSYRLVVLK